MATPSRVTPSRVIVLTSPKAGSGAQRHQVPRLMQLLDQSGIPAVLTDDVADVTSAPDGAVVVAAGGDGTMTLAASRLQGRKHVAVMPLPMGTENLLARHFGFQSDASEVLRTIQQGMTRTMDLGLITSRKTKRPSTRSPGGASDDTPMPVVRPMLTMVTCGFDAEVVRQLHLRRSGHIRRSSYLVPICRVLGKYRFPEITIQAFDRDGSMKRDVGCGWAMVFNLPCYGGGLSIHPDAVGDDGVLDVIAFKGRSIASGLRYLAAILAGRHFHLADTVRFQASRIRIETSDRVAYQIDGDYVGRLPIEIQVQPNAVNLLMPVGVYPAK